MSTIDLGPDADDDMWRDILRIESRASVGHGEHVATAGCAHHGCTVWFVHGGPEGAAQQRARDEGWSVHGDQAYCPAHAS